MPEPTLVCVLCGRPWEPSVKNRCECGGFCSWGEKLGGKPSSWNVSNGRWTPKPVAEHWYDTFANCFTGAEKSLVINVLSMICKTEYKDGMVAASKIAANYELEAEDNDKLCREIGRAILEEAYEQTNHPPSDPYNLGIAR